MSILNNYSKALALYNVKIIIKVGKYVDVIHRVLLIIMIVCNYGAFPVLILEFWMKSKK